MKKITLDYTPSSWYVNEQELSYMEPQVDLAALALMNQTGAGNEFLGWVNLPNNYCKNEFARIKATSEKIKKHSEILLVIGIGGSYLGARAAIEFVKSEFHNDFAKNENVPEIYFVGNGISAKHLINIKKLVGNKDFSINIISKSGTTTEPAIAFRIFKKILEDKYGKTGAKDRIFATTDEKKGALLELAVKEGYEKFIVPDNVGGRYSVLTAVGLLPIACAGIDIDKLIEGAKAAFNDTNLPFSENDCYKYAAIRNILNRKGKKTEILVNYEPNLCYIAEWWKQLYGESEGKDGKGLFPASVTFSTDLHSMGQFIQDGDRTLFETVLNVENSKEVVKIEKDELNLDGLNYLVGKDMHFVNQMAAKGTLLAHTDGKVPNLTLNVPEINEYYLGYLFYFFEKACAISGYLLGVNPFDQPGVEAYKKNMFALLGKPGYENEKKELEARL